MQVQPVHVEEWTYNLSYATHPNYLRFIIVINNNNTVPCDNAIYPVSNEAISPITAH